MKVPEIVTVSFTFECIMPVRDNLLPFLKAEGDGGQPSTEGLSHSTEGGGDLIFTPAAV